MRSRIKIYLDSMATTPMDPRVFEVMKPYFLEKFGNSSSVNHVFGWEAEQAIKKATEQVAQLIGAQPQEIIWTSGATESVNLSLLGTFSEGHVITTKFEHKSVLETCHYLEKAGIRVSYLTPDVEGRLDPQEVLGHIHPDTRMVSVIAANNEVGTVLPIKEIGLLLKKQTRPQKILFHVDAAQMVGKIPLNVEECGIDLLSFSAHKLYGPKGVGVLYHRLRNPHIALSPIIHGSGQQKGLRSGTLPVPLIVGCGKACAIAEKEMAREGKRILRLRNKLQKGIQDSLQGVEINGSEEFRIPGNLNLSFEGLSSDQILGSLAHIALSAGSACTSGSRDPSYVLKAMGLSDDRARSAIRFGLHRFTTSDEIDIVIRTIITLIKKLRG